MSEQKTFKYLDQANAQGGDAAQDFLNKKMSGNRYMSVSNPDNPYSMGEGSTPTGAAYDDQRKVITPSSTSFEGGLDIKKRQSDHANANKYTVDELRQKFGLSYDAKREAKGFKTGSENAGANNDNEVWYETGSGEKKLLGYKEGGLNSLLDNKELNNVRKADTERFSPTNGFNSESDVSGTLRYLVKQGEEKTTEAEYAPAEPIKHSPEIKQAKERVQSYEQDALTGKTSEAIFGKGEAQADNQYQFDATQGIQAFGSSPSNNEAASTATQSFLDKKVFDVKKKLEPSV